VWVLEYLKIYDFSLDKSIIELYKQVINIYGINQEKMFTHSFLVLIIAILVLVLIESLLTIGWKREGVKA
jgi:hypothetical protein